MEELTKEQVRRQDFVDNEINWMLTHLMKDLKPQDTSYGWSIEDIAKIRDVVFPILESEYYGRDTGFIPLEEMDFYPYLEDEEDEEIHGDFTECQSCHNPITWEVYAKNTGLCFECSDKIN